MNEYEMRLRSMEFAISQASAASSHHYFSAEDILQNAKLFFQFITNTEPCTKLQEPQIGLSLERVNEVMKSL